MDLSNIKKETTYIGNNGNVCDVGENGGNVDENKQSKISNVKSYVLRRTIKPILSVAVNKIHSGLKGKYDKFVYTYSDPRLIFLEKIAKDYIKENVKGKSDADMINKMVDVAIGIFKEDIYYRVRGFVLLNRFMEENVRFVLTDEEKTYL